jgi:hypothetical protein
MPGAVQQQKEGGGVLYCRAPAAVIFEAYLTGAARSSNAEVLVMPARQAPQQTICCNEQCCYGLSTS